MMNTVIQKISARQVLDCKARPMLEVDVFTQDGSMGRGARAHRNLGRSPRGICPPGL